jgi:DNA processing protein
MHARATPAVVRLADDDYPPLLREIHDPPPELMLLGRLEPGDVRAVAVVGSRHPSEYGLMTAERLGGELAAAGVTVVSGLALGIDGAAHRGALAAGGRTIAVLGSGLDRIFPAQHRELATMIAGQGAVVSEFALGTEPYPGNFPRRNRIVSGLARAVVVVEAGERSGSLITARLAGEQGRDVYSVPGEVCLERTRGTHRLLRQGAAPVETALDVLQGTFGERLTADPDGRSAKRPIAGLGDDERRMIDCFDRTLVPLDRLIAASRLSAERVLELLLTLEVQGIVRRHPGPAYSLGRRKR